MNKENYIHETFRNLDEETNNGNRGNGTIMLRNDMDVASLNGITTTATKYFLLSDRQNTQIVMPDFTDIFLNVTLK